MKYVKEWVTSRTNDKAFMEVVRKSRTFEPRDPRPYKQIDLEWGYLGFTPEYASLTFNFKPTDEQDFDATRIESVSLTQSRVSIIIDTNEIGDLGLLWSPEALRELKPVGDNVFVYCGSSE